MSATSKHGPLLVQRDWLWVLLPVAVFAGMVALFPCWTMEDAYIMLRYARNLANGFGFAYNPGDPPVWGSTSLLTTAVLAGLIRTGLSPLLASQSLGVTLSVILVLSVYAIERRVLKLGNFPAIASCVVLATTQLVPLSMMGFDAIVFTLVMTLLFGTSLWVVRYPKLTARSPPVCIMCLLAILLSLARIEGTLVSAFTMIVVIWIRRDMRRWQFLLCPILPFVAVVVTFLTWTTFYFGVPLPLPLYIKVAGSSIPGLSAFLLAWFLFGYLFELAVIILWLNRFGRAMMKPLVLLTLPTVAYALAYLAIQPLQNIANRFQFPIAPVLMILLAQALTDLLPIRQLTANRRLTVSLRFLSKRKPFLLLILALAANVGVAPFILPYGELPEALQMAQVLHKYHDNGYTMVVSEAGRIPYYAEWRSIDSFGLNNPTIAFYGLTDSYLAAINPEVIMFNMPLFAEYTATWAASSNRWDVMCRTLYLYATDHNYTKACIVQIFLREGFLIFPIGYHWYFVRNDFTDSAAIINDLRTISGLVYMYP